MSNLPLIVFDVNETLLDLDTMTPIFERIFREKEAMRLWFANLILYSEALTLAKAYVPFTDIGGAVLKMLAATRGISITAADEKELKDKFSTMPPHREVPAALRKLKAAGFRLFTLTDNLLEVQGRQLEHGGIIHEFERRFSVDQEVRLHKPAPEAYAYVERQLGVSADRLFLIASHTWDTLGAVAAGWGAALIKRPGNDVLGVGPQPGFVGTDLNEVADMLIRRFAGQVKSAT
jgi:2-haloacid dehalogenase